MGHSIFDIGDGVATSAFSLRKSLVGSRQECCSPPLAAKTTGREMQAKVSTGLDTSRVQSQPMRSDGMWPFIEAEAGSTSEWTVLHKKEYAVCSEQTRPGRYIEEEGLKKMKNY